MITAANNSKMQHITYEGAHLQSIRVRTEEAAGEFGRWDHASAS